MTTSFALGEVQDPEAPATRHAVADAQPDRWGQAVCGATTRVWVHGIANDVLPFPGPLGLDWACPECLSIVRGATSDSAKEAPQRPWSVRWDWLRRRE